MESIDNKILKLEYELGFSEIKSACSREESEAYRKIEEAGEQLPEWVLPDDETSSIENRLYYKYGLLSQEEREKIRYLLMLKQSKSMKAMKKNLRTIKNCVTFCTIVLVIVLLRYLGS